jgi:ribosomal 50S subunit-recycling heat shock protein
VGDREEIPKVLVGRKSLAKGILVAGRVVVVGHRFNFGKRAMFLGPDEALRIRVHEKVSLQAILGLEKVRAKEELDLLADFFLCLARVVRWQCCLEDMAQGLVLLFFGLLR